MFCHNIIMILAPYAISSCIVIGAIILCECQPGKPESLRVNRYKYPASLFLENFGSIRTESHCVHIAQTKHTFSLSVTRSLSILLSYAVNGRWQWYCLLQNSCQSYMLCIVLCKCLLDLFDVACNHMIQWFDAAGLMALGACLSLFLTRPRCAFISPAVYRSQWDLSFECHMYGLNAQNTAKHDTFVYEHWACIEASDAVYKKWPNYTIKACKQWAHQAPSTSKLF